MEKTKLSSDLFSNVGYLDVLVENSGVVIFVSIEDLFEADAKTPLIQILPVYPTCNSEYYSIKAI